MEYCWKEGLGEVESHATGTEPVVRFNWVLIGRASLVGGDADGRALLSAEFRRPPRPQVVGAVAMYPGDGVAGGVVEGEADVDCLGGGELPFHWNGLEVP